MLSGAPISWQPKRQKTVSLSTCEAEYVAASELAKEIVWLRGFIKELGLDDLAKQTIEMQIDNEAALKLSKNPEFHAMTKHIEIRYHFLRERVLAGDFKTVRVGSKDKYRLFVGRPGLGKTCKNGKISSLTFHGVVFSLVITHKQT